MTDPKPAAEVLAEALHEALVGHYRGWDNLMGDAAHMGMDVDDPHGWDTAAIITALAARGYVLQPAPSASNALPDFDVGGPLTVAQEVGVRVWMASRQGMPASKGFIVAARLLVTLDALRKVAQEAVEAAGTENWPVNCDALRAALLGTVPQEDWLPCAEGPDYLHLNSEGQSKCVPCRAALAVVPQEEERP